MRVLASWPMATLLIGVAALMGINAATSPGQNPRDYAVNEEAAGSPTLHQSEPVAMTDFSEPLKHSDQCIPLQQMPGRPLPLLATAPVQPAPNQTPEVIATTEFGWQAVETPAWALAALPNAVAKVVCQQTSDVCNASPSACCLQATPASTSKAASCDAKACATKSCATKSCATNSWASQTAPAKSCATKACCQAKQVAAAATDSARVYDQQVDAEAEQWQAIDLSTAVNNSPPLPQLPHVQVFATTESDVDTHCPQDRAINLEVHAIAAGPEQNPFAVFGPQAALAEHLAMMHQRLGELQGEAAGREANLELSKVNAQMTAKLEAMEELHALMDGMVQKSIEVAEMKAEQRLHSMHAAYAMQAPTITLPEPQDPSEPPQHPNLRLPPASPPETVLPAEPNVEFAEDVVMQLRRENEELRKELNQLRQRVAKLLAPEQQPATPPTAVY